MIIERMADIEAKYASLEERLTSPDVFSNQEEYIRLTKERASLEALMQKIREYRLVEAHIAEAEELLAGDAGDMRELAEDELTSNKEKRTELEQEIQVLLLPSDPNDEKNTIVEIRAGTGGEEAALFAGTLYRMYLLYADTMGWQHEEIDASPSGLGGYKEVIFMVKGNRVYSRLKFESGGHRVQRVPETEASGRIHTSAATVAVMPEVDEVEINIDPKDLVIDVYRASGAGGQHVNRTESAVRITHVPTGLVVTCQDEKSQIKNRARAMKVLFARLNDLKRREQEKELSSTRKSLIGSGDRSERIRTYNFPQNRITDHRINYTAYNLNDVVNGKLDDLIEHLIVADQAQRLEEATT